jgi:hypothetical protein
MFDFVLNFNPTNKESEIRADGLDKLPKSLQNKLLFQARAS